jgi:hypothetical protein
VVAIYDLDALIDGTLDPSAMHHGPITRRTPWTEGMIGAACAEHQVIAVTPSVRMETVVLGERHAYYEPAKIAVGTPERYEVRSVVGWRGDGERPLAVGGTSVDRTLLSEHTSVAGGA